jgi:hypothetical protein
MLLNEVLKLIYQEGEKIKLDATLMVVPPYQSLGWKIVDE